MSRRLNIPIPDALTLEAMAGAKRTARMSGCQSTYQLLRETFFDTPEWGRYARIRSHSDCAPRRVGARSWNCASWMP